MNEDIKKSDMWSEKYNLPLYQRFNNPILYCAYFTKMLNLDNDIPYITRCEQYLESCQVKDNPGLLNRWPDGDGGLTSHDELIGAAYLYPHIAALIIQYCIKTDGIYNNLDPDSDNDKYNLYRMGWAIAYIRFRAGLKVNLLNQSWLAGFYISSALSNDKGMSHHLLCWIMEEEASKHPISKIGVLVWKNKIKKRNLDGKEMLRQYFPDLKFLIDKSEIIKLDDTFEEHA